MACAPSASWQACQFGLRAKRPTATGRESSSDYRIRISRRTHDCQSIVGFLFAGRFSSKNSIYRGKNMKTQRNKMAARFAPKTRSRMRPLTPVPYRGTFDTELHQLQARLLREQSALLTNSDHGLMVRGAANEATALAATTPYPLLLLPGLFEEKVEAAQRYLERQARIRKRSANLLEV